MVHSFTDTVVYSSDYSKPFDINHIKRVVGHPFELPNIDYKFNEKELIDELQKYVDKTYGQHYAQDKIQATEMIIDMGDGIGFCRGNIFKYAKRYGKKAGHNRDDLMKVLHYALMLLYVHDMNEVNN